MKFSIYSELQSWPGKSVRHSSTARCWSRSRTPTGSATTAYAAVEHLFFPKFSASANVFGLFGMAAARTRQIKFRTMLHILPYHNPLVLAAMIHQFSILTNGRYEFGVGRGHGWIPLPAGLPLDETSRPRYEEALDLFIEALHNEHGHLPRRLLERRRQPHRPVQRPHASASSSAAPPTRPTTSPRSTAGASRCRRCCPYAALKDQLDLYRSKCAEYGTKPDIVWIHACYIDEDREVAKREAEKHMRGFLAGNASPLTEHAPPPADRLNAAGYGFYASGIMEKLAATPYDEMIAGDIVWVGTPDDVIERVRETIDVCEGLTEIAITTNPGGVEHWKAIKARSSSPST